MSRQRSSLSASGEPTSEDAFALDVGDEVELRSRRPKTLQLNISKDYVKDWSTKDAFRELCQNWRDAIVESFDTDPTFNPEYEENSRTITVKAVLPGPGSSKTHERLRRYMGFIRFSKKTGTIVLANANAHLELKHLQLGHDRDCAKGHYGEGFKLAIVTMVGARYRVRIEASGHSWYFSSCGTPIPYFFCAVHSSRKKDADLEVDTMSNCKNRVSKDVAVVIQTGHAEAERKLQRTEFLDWLSLVFGIRGISRPIDVVQTQHGDLITDKEFGTRVYVKGLLCQEKQGLVYGYNLYHAGTGLGPRYSVDDNCLSEVLCRLWEAAIQEKPVALLPLYTNLLCDPQEPLDVKEADKFLGKSTAEGIWRHLLRETKDGFFYHSGNDAENLCIIKDYIGKEPVLITEILWRILRNAQLIRTPKEEQAEQFKNAEEIAPPDSVFSKTLQRMLKSTLMLNKATQNIGIAFVDCKGNNNVQIRFNAQSNVLKIRKAWLDFHTIHAEYPCMVYQMNPDIGDTSFFCDHIFEILYEKTIKTIFGCTTPVSSRLWKNQSQKTRDKTLQMPRNVTIEHGLNANQLVVFWGNGISQQVLSQLKENCQYHIILHDEQCADKAHMVLHDEVNMGWNTLCTCVQQIVPHGTFVAIFDDLDPSTSYFPMVAWNSDDSFYGLPPCPIKPGAPSTSEDSDFPSNDPELSFSLHNATANEDSVMNIDGQGHESSLELECRWKQWEKEVFPKVFSKLNPSYESGVVKNCRLLSAYESRRLNWTFAKREYAMVTMGYQGCSEQQAVFVLYTHGIRPAIETNKEDEGVLLTTPYFVGWLDSISRSDDGQIIQSDAHKQECLSQLKKRGLMLHFKKFDSMASWHDASHIPIKWISAIYAIEPELLGTFQYATEVPKDSSQPGLLCRFAHHCDGPDDAICATPIASHLLPESKRWMNPRYNTKSTPVVLDLSPGVLGAAEGLRQCGFEICAGLGFNPTTHQTWKAAHGSAFILDGTLHSVVSDIKASKLNPLPPVPQGTPRIAILCVANKLVSDGREQMREGFEVLDCLDDILALPPRLDFLVLIFPPWVLHKHTEGYFFRSVKRLLTNRYCVNIKTVPLSSLGVPRDETVIILIASTFYSPVPWNEYFDSNSETQLDPVTFDQIHDLAFCNLRTTDPLAAESLVCKSPTTNTNVYNHQTGLAVPSSHVLDLGPLVTMSSATLIRHPERYDRLTVRELARIQGFSDDFLFLGPTQQQYEDVTQAFPPSVAKKIGLIIWDLIRRLRSDDVVFEEDGVDLVGHGVCLVRDDVGRKDEVGRNDVGSEVGITTRGRKRRRMGK